MYKLVLPIGHPWNTDKQIEIVNYLDAPENSMVITTIRDLAIFFWLSPAGVLDAFVDMLAKEFNWDREDVCQFMEHFAESYSDLTDEDAYWKTYND